DATVDARISWIARLSSGRWSKTQYFSRKFALRRLQPGAGLEESYALIPQHSSTQVTLNIYGPASLIEPGQSLPEIPNGIVAINQVASGSVIGLLIFVTVENENGDRVDADIRIWMVDAGTNADGSLAWVVTCNGFNFDEKTLSEDFLQ